METGLFVLLRSSIAIGARPTIDVGTGWSLLRKPTRLPISTKISGLTVKRITIDKLASLRPAELEYRM
jgi:hypothetical protein